MVPESMLELVQSMSAVGTATFRRSQYADERGYRTPTLLFTRSAGYLPPHSNSVGWQVAGPTEVVGGVQERLGLADHAVRLGHARHDVRVARDGLAVTIVGERVPAKRRHDQASRTAKHAGQGWRGGQATRRSLRPEDKILECLAATADDGDDLHEDAVLLLTGRAECRRHSSFF